MLAHLFRKQLLQTQIIPIFGYTELKSYYQSLDDSINTVLLIGFGGAIDLENFLEIDSTQYQIDESGNQFSRNIYVWDTHRPWNLDNLFGSSMIKCLDDGTVEENLMDIKTTYYKLIELDTKLMENGEEDHDSSSDEEGETEEDIPNDTEEDDNNENEAKREEEEDDDERVFLNNNNKRSHEEVNEADLTPKQIRKQRKKQVNELESSLEEYYSQGTTMVNSVASQIYSMLSSIGETNLTQLWLTVLGVTSLDTEYTQVYQRLAPILQDEVKRLSPNNGLYSSKTSDLLSITLEPDYYLFLLRQSSLYDSFLYSNYVNAKLSLWNDLGRKRLHKMFARMGIPLVKSQESWLYMDHSIKRDLKLIFEKNLDRYGLQDIIRDGFVKSQGYHQSITASEFVESLLALLETDSINKGGENGNNVTIDSANKNSTDNVDNTGVNDSNNNNNNDDNTNGNNMLMRKRENWISNFWLSWDALDDNKVEYLKEGLIQAKRLQKIVFDTGMTILEKRMIRHLRVYRLCVLQDGPHLSNFYNPLSLIRLGNWLIECCTEFEDNSLVPIVLCALNEVKDTYLVAGLTPRYPRGWSEINSKKPLLNNFTIAFQQIGSQTGAQVKIDNFESSIIEIKRDDLSPFLEKLTLSGLI